MRTNYIRTLTLFAVALAAWLIVTAVWEDPAEARKKRSVTWIVFASNQSTDSTKDPVSTDLEIFRMNADGTGLKQLTFNSVEDRQPTLSADGLQIAFTRVQPASGDGGDGNADIWLMLSDGSSAFNYTGWIGSDESTPDFSPNGRIAFTWQCDTSECSTSGTTSEEIAVIEVDGSAHLLTHTYHSAYEFRPDFSPDGTKIAFTRLASPGTIPGVEYQMDILVMDSDPNTNDTPTDLSKNSIAGCQSQGTCINDFRPRWSPDGTKIVYDSAGGNSDLNPEGDFEVFVMNAADGSGKRNLTKNATDDVHPDYSPSGKHIVYNRIPNADASSSSFGYSSPNKTPGELFKMDANGANKRNLTKKDNQFINQSPDWGKKFRW